MNAKGRTAGRAPRADGLRTRQALIDAAVDLFAESSLEATSVRAIGAHAGVDPALVARYFGSKEGLFVAALTSISDGFDLAAVFAGANNGEQGEAIARYLLAGAGEPRTLAMVLRAASSPATADLVAEHLVQRVEAQVRAGLRGRDKATRASAIVAVITGATTAQLLYAMDGTRTKRFVDLTGAAIQAVIDAG